MNANQIEGAVKETQGAVQREVGKLQNQGRKALDEMLENQRKVAASAWADTQDWVRDNPLPSLAIAAGVGFALGALLSLRD